MTLQENRRESPRRSVTGLIARIGIPILGLAGVAVSGYLTYIHYTYIKPVCVFNLECDEVLSSSYAAMWGVPLALLGLVMYVVIIDLGLLLWRKDSEWEHLIALGTYGVALAGIVFTGYLYYLEIFVLHAFCSWCIISSIVLACIFVISLVNFISIKRRLERSPHARPLKLSHLIGW